MDSPFNYSEAIAFSHTFRSSAPRFAIIGLRASGIYLSIRDHICTPLPGDWAFWQRLCSMNVQYDIVDGAILWHFRSTAYKQTIPFIDPEQFYIAVHSFFNTLTLSR
jgi:hypothetical protein